MNIRSIFTKQLEVPENNETLEVDVAQLWEVRWKSRHSEYSAGTRPEVEVFLSQQEAQDFAESLQQAFSLIRHTSGNYVQVYRSR